MSKIVTLKDNTTTRPIYPITNTKAVIDDNGNSVESLIEKINTDSEGYVISEDTSVDNNNSTIEDIDINVHDAILKIKQDLSETERKQARDNINAADEVQIKDILNKLFWNIGLDKIEVYSLEKDYHPEDIVLYDLVIYKFIKEHPCGFWEKTHVKRISIIDVILKQLKSIN